MIVSVLLFLVGFSYSQSCSNNGSSLISNGISEDNINLILKLHNKLRANVALGNVENQEKAKNMLKMSWDDDLASLAQNWSNNCVYKHDYNMTDPLGRFDLGQNIAITQHSQIDDENPDFSFIFNLWASEKDNFNYSEIMESDILRTGENQTLHYTQIVAAKTYLVGCGYTLYVEEEGFYPYGKFYVCNYGPLGNIESEYPYESRDGYEPVCNHKFEDSNIDGLCELRGPNKSLILPFNINTKEDQENILEKTSFTIENDKINEEESSKESNSTIEKLEILSEEMDLKENNTTIKLFESDEINEVVNSEEANSMHIEIGQNNTEENLKEDNNSITEVVRNESTLENNSTITENE